MRPGPDSTPGGNRPGRRAAAFVARRRRDRAAAPEFTGEDLVDPRFFANLGSLELIARSVVEGFLHGLHRSPSVGFSVEFASHREYLPGDDLRHLNWKLYGKCDKLYVKQYDAETNLDCHLLLDISGSMDTRTAGLTKRRYAAALAAAVAYLALRQNDAVGLTMFADRVIQHLRPRARTTQLNDLIAAINAERTRPAAATARALHEAAALMPRRGLVVLLSDLFLPTDELFGGLDHIRFVGHDVLVFHVLDPLERALILDGPLRFHDLETGEELTTRAAEIREAYAAAVDGWLEELDEGCLVRGIDRLGLTTDRRLDTALYEYLLRRERHY